MGAAIVILDADLQDPPELIPDMVRAWREGADVVCMRRRSRAGESWLKRASAYAYYRLLNRLSKADIPADTGDFRLMSRKAVQALLQLPERCRYMKGMYAWIGLPTRILDYDRDPRAAGATKWNYLGLMRLAMEGITSFSTAPLRWATGLGVAAALAGVGFGIVITIKTLLLGEEVHGYPSLIAIITFLSGVQLITIGLLGEYVGKTYMESKQRPVYLLRDVQPHGGIAPARIRTRHGGGPGLRIRARRRGRPGAPGRRIRRHDRRGSACGQLLRPCCWAWRPSAARLFAMAVMPLADTSEPRYAEIARLMAVTGDWVTPWFEPGVPFWGKPPLAFWAPALSIKLLGLSEFSLRLPAFAAMLGVLALVHAFAARRFGVSAARWAALVFATMLLPLASAGAVLTDPYLALGVTLSMTSFLLARRDGPRGGAMASSWVWRSACCPRAVGPGAGGGRRAALVAAARRTRAVARAALDRRHDPDAGAGPALVRDGRDPHARLPPVLHRGRAFPALRRPGLARRSVRHRAQAALWRHLAGLAAGDHALGTGGPVAVPAARPGRAAADPAGVAGARSAARLPAAGAWPRPRSSRCPAISSGPTCCLRYRRWRWRWAPGWRTMRRRRAGAPGCRRR